MHNSATSKKSYQYAALCGLAMGTAIGTSIAIIQRMAMHHRMPNLKAWQKALIAKHGEVQGAILAARIQARYEALYHERPHFTHPALRWHLEQYLLPGLALYQVLRKEISDHEAVLAEVGSLLELGSVFRAFNTFVKLHMLPLPFALFRWAVRVSLLAYPHEGWRIDQLEQSNRSFAFTISRCFYLDILTAYEAPELTPLYCRLDDLAYANLSPSIRWERTKTLGRGDDCCDFRWSRVEVGRGAPRLIQMEAGRK
jgi:L-2-amino-thiazoline-4-carboxylic acid hydrolase-like protein